MRHTRVLAGLLACATFIPVAASAATLDAQLLMQTVNVIVLGDMDLRNTDHVEGPVYVGGDMNSGALTSGTVTFPNISINTDGMANAAVGSVSGSVVIGGTMNGNFQGATKGDVVVGAAYAGSTFGGGTVTQGVGTDVAGGVPVAEMTATFDALTTTLASIATTTGATFDTTMNSKSITSGTGGSDGIAVLNLTYADAISMFSNAENLSFNLDSGISSLIINVAGSDFGTTGYWDSANNVWVPGAVVNAQINGNQPKVLFNFYEATNVVLGTVWNASILATNALLTSSGGGTNGTVVAKDLILGGEIRPYNDTTLFSGALPAGVNPVPAPVPLPAALPLVLSGVIALGALGCKRRKAA